MEKEGLLPCAVATASDEAKRSGLALVSFLKDQLAVDLRLDIQGGLQIYTFVMVVKGDFCQNPRGQNKRFFPSFPGFCGGILSQWQITD